MNDFRFIGKSKDILENKKLHPKIKEFMEDVLKESKYDISIIEGVRTQDAQISYFEKGLSELDGVEKMSDHQAEKYEDNLARAIDFIPYAPDKDIWVVEDLAVKNIWTECFRAILRVDRLWKQKGIDVGLELGWTYNIGSGRDYPHISFKGL